MPFFRRQFSGNAPTANLLADIAAGALSFSVQTGQGANFPDGTVGLFVVTFARGKSTEEKVLCLSRTGDAFTVNPGGRGYDGTVAALQTAQSTVEHTIAKVDVDEANQAVVNTIGRVSALGDLLIGSGPNALSRLPVGSAGQELTVAGGTVAWATPAAPALSYAQTVLGADVGLSSGVATSIVTVSLAAGTWMVTGSLTVAGVTNPVSVWLQRMDTNAGIGIGAEASASGSGYGYAAVPIGVVVLGGTTTVALFAQSAGTGDTVFHTPRAGGNMPNMTGIVAVKIA